MALELIDKLIWRLLSALSFDGTCGLIYGAVQEDKPDKRRLRLNDILGGRPIIYVFPCQLLIPSWPQHSATYVGLKGQAGRVVTAVFINLARRNAALNSRVETETLSDVTTLVCACRQHGFPAVKGGICNTVSTQSSPPQLHALLNGTPLRWA